MKNSFNHKYECVVQKILGLVQRSPVPEDPLHAKNTLQWVRKLSPNTDMLIEIAALGHDVERALQNRKARKEEFFTYDDYKNAHAKYSAEIISEFMRQCGWDSKAIQKVSTIVSLHEKGGTPEADLLKDADSLSFFQVNLPFYYKRSKKEEVIDRCMWGLKRLSEPLRPIVKEFKYKEPEIQKIVAKLLGEIN